MIRRLYKASAGEVQNAQVDMVWKVVQMVENDRIDVECAGNMWDNTIESVLGTSVVSAEPDNEQSRLRHVEKAIQAVYAKSDSAFIRRCLFLLFMRATINTLQAADRKRQLLGLCSGEYRSQVAAEFRKSYNAGGRFARLFGRNVGYVFFLKAGAASM